MLETIEEFTAKAIGIDISNNTVKAVEESLGIYVDIPADEILHKNKEEITDVWENPKDVSEIIKYRASKLWIICLSRI
ncbi:hypothetical protein OXPF_35730 [Oxobacter pfennigii]|uniref:Uncharacterized protein n=1 Tax=Oxobacter pfennigii TaxID=36849 RepID=A0A0P8W4S8_9CLOT|nr:hypothetical protein [Oxobacter pfennigii]KPU42810.1 hypothetical protein OXPF_35730 [Oxobacter pfennigii]